MLTMLFFKIVNDFYFLLCAFVYILNMYTELYHFGNQKKKLLK
jgi:hypothetical protein